MASSLTKTPLLRTVATRGYSQLAPVSGTTTYDVKTSTLANRLTCVSAENESPIARVSILFKAGSRNETPDCLGAAHVVRVAAGLSTVGASQFAITRNIQQVGASLSCTSDREVISYTLEGTRQAVEKVLPFLSEVATQQQFRPWEVAELSNRLKLELAVRPLQLRAIDLLHKAAFRTGLGNSLFIPKFQIGKISSETLQHYVGKTFASNRAAVVGLGLDDQLVCQLAQSLSLDPGSDDVPKSPYKGGEIRSDKGGDYAFVAIAGEGACVGNAKEALATAVLQKALGVGPQVQWNTNDNGIVSRGISAGEYASSAINASYSDTGLVGVLLAVPAKTAGKVVEGAVNALKNVNASEADISRGKALLKRDLLSQLESGSKAVQVLGTQAVLTGNVLSPCQLVAEIDAVSASDVKNAAQKMSRKLTIASVGNLSNVPYADDLKL